ncbi:hypothetical protein [Streptacidiphilus anmyonensis]|uniref:hypothetical protein n=1 Tax=Streptacidiphilus anmyonensis TaxID=405782 RepID=UPI00069342B2|nr:hypothetical protein [Streptacidiphilus anmyonensis]
MATGDDKDTALPSSCPRCGQELVRETTRSRRGTHEWRKCPDCAWMGRPDPKGAPILHPFHRPTGEEADCVFCGEEECNRASESFVWDGRLCEWIVCTACGRENVRRIGPSPA